MNYFCVPMADTVKFSQVYDLIVSKKKNRIKSGGIDSPSILNRLKVQVIANALEMTQLGMNYHILNPLKLSNEEVQALKGCYVSGTNIDETNYFFEVYKIVKNATQNNLYFQTICPYCGIGKIDTMDHILPQSLYSELSFFPNNLIRVCGTCNEKYKLNHIVNPINKERFFINPYVDIFLNINLLEFNFIIISDSNTAIVKAKPFLTLNRLSEREKIIVSNHFEKLELLDRIEEKFEMESIKLTNKLIEFKESELSILARCYKIDFETSMNYCSINNFEAKFYEKLTREDFLLAIKNDLIGGVRTNINN